MSEVLRQPAELTYAEDLQALKAADKQPKPVGWYLSPQAVVTYVLGGTVGNRTIDAKYVGNRRIIETAVATLATDRALLLMGIPGTAKSWVSEHLAAAISGDSTKIIQCTAAPMKIKFDTVGITRSYWPKDQVAKRSYQRRCCEPWRVAVSVDWKN